MHKEAMGLVGSREGLNAQGGYGTGGAPERVWMHKMAMRLMGPREGDIQDGYGKGGPQRRSGCAWLCGGFTPEMICMYKVAKTRTQSVPLFGIEHWSNSRT